MLVLVLLVSGHLHQRQSGERLALVRALICALFCCGAHRHAFLKAGWGDGNIADFFLNDRKIDIRGEAMIKRIQQDLMATHAAHVLCCKAGRRGLNVVTIDPDTQQARVASHDHIEYKTPLTKVMSRKTYDVWADPQTENTRLAMMAEEDVILRQCFLSKR